MKSKKRKAEKRPAKPAKAQVRKAAKPTKRAPRPIELYYWPTPNGWKVSMMLEECKLPYVLKAVNIGKGEQFEPGFLKISPNNRMPAIVDPDGPGGKSISVFESVPSCNTWVARPASSIPQMSASASKSMNGCSGRWRALVR